MEKFSKYNLFLFIYLGVGGDKFFLGFLNYNIVILFIFLGGFIVVLFILLGLFLFLIIGDLKINKK